MMKFNLQLFGGLFGGRGGGSGIGGGTGAPTSKSTGTQSLNKSQSQIFKEVDELEGLPAGSKIEVWDSNFNRWDTLTAHDQARIGRNGRFLTKRVYSVIAEKFDTKNLGRNVTSTTDPYYVAQRPWRKK